MGRPQPRNKRLTRDQSGPKQQKPSRDRRAGRSRSGGRGRGRGKGRGKGRGRRGARQEQKHVVPEDNATDSAKKLSFSEWVEKEADRRELARQQLIRQREGNFDGPIVDVLAMQAKDKKVLLDFVRKGVSVDQTPVQLNGPTSNSPAPGSSEGEVCSATETTASNHHTPAVALEGAETDSDSPLPGSPNGGIQVAEDEDFVPDEQLLSYLTTQLLFGEDQVMQALRHTSNVGLVPALDWLCLNTTDEELGHAFYGRAPVLTDELVDELSARTTSISVRRFDFHIEVCICAMRIFSL